MKKKTIIFLSIISTIILIYASVIIIHSIIVKRKNEEVIKNTSYYKECEIINKYNTNIYVYGEEKRNFKYLNPRSISSFEELDLSSDYNVLIVNDLYTETVMRDEDYLTIKNTILEGNNKLMFLYYGNKKFEKFMEYGIETTAPREDTLGILYGPSRYHSGIFYTTSDFESATQYPKLFEQNLSSIIVNNYLKEVIG